MPEPIRLEEKRRGPKIANTENTYYETVIAVALDIVDKLKPVVHRVPADELDAILDAMKGALFIRDRTIQEKKRRKGEGSR
jgi:hypothetical protein